MERQRTDKRKLSIFYISLLVLFLFGLWFVGMKGGEMQSTIVGHAVEPEAQGGLSGAFSAFGESVGHHFTGTIGILLLQIIVILTVARIVAWLFGKIGQPTVIGEIVAGILLGPSLLGALWPEAYHTIFPRESLGNLELLSQFGLILFMFVIGMELNLNDIKAQLRQSLVISHAGIFIPFLLGLSIAYVTYKEYASITTSFLPYALFIGISMSITAFPVLARIIQERQMGKTHLGMLSLSTAAAGDISAWLMLAGVMAITQSGSFLSAIFNFLFLILYLLVIFGLIRPFFKMIGKLYDNQEVVGKTMVGFIFVLLLASAYATELLSMHALFGAFMLGLVMPENFKFRKILTEKVEDVSLALFLPLFFVSSGLQTKLGLLD
uniref:cation:proton antiporter domain-containing protein n=1 Tax=Porphyromonas loveana TaxID=1884669 RepID=UPI0035A0D334